MHAECLGVVHEWRVVCNGPLLPLIWPAALLLRPLGGLLLLEVLLCIADRDGEPVAGCLCHAEQVLVGCFEWFHRCLQRGQGIASVALLQLVQVILEVRQDYEGPVGSARRSRTQRGAAIAPRRRRGEGRDVLEEGLLWVTA